MAATVSPWSKPGAWALDAEEHEAELLQQQKDSVAAAAAAADFPTLTTAVAGGGGKSKKKKGQTLSLAAFTAYGGPKAAEPSSTGLTHEDLLTLPKGPRERTAEELDRNRLGGGFRNYGDRNGSRGGGEWGGQRGSDRERGGGGRDSVRDSGPSRADEVDNWASVKKPSIGSGFERRESGRDRGGFFDSQSKADESDSWVTNKSFAPPPAEARRFGGGRVGFTSNGGGSDSDFWGKRREESSNGFGGGSEGGAGRPRLNLQRRTLPIDNNNGGTAAAAAVAAVAKPKGANPFGEARPREEVLAEKGQDWKKIDEQLDSMKIKEASERAEGGGSASFGKQRSFGSGNGRSGSSGGRTESSWRKPEHAAADDAAADADDAQSAEKNEDEESAAEN